MSKVCQRLLVFFIGIPLVLAFVFFDVYDHLLLHALIVLISALAASEFYDMAKDKYKMFPKWYIVISSLILPLSTYILNIFGKSSEITPWIFSFEILIMMAIEVFSEKNFDKTFEKLSSSTLIIFYCGFMITFISRMAGLENSTHYIALFLILVFMCDSSAWFFGILFGKSTRGYVAASPNKSIIGFIGGILGSAVFGLLFSWIFSEIIPFSPWKILLTSLLTSICAIIGDLVESVFKRSLGKKDSGVIIPGRGGVLDSIDSILAAAPVFYTCVHFLYI